MTLKSKISVLIADDHAIYLDGLETLLSKDEEIEIIGTASEGARLIQLTKQLVPDVVLTDIKMPGVDGIDAIREISALRIPTACIALSTFDTDSLIVEALEAGAMGYITKNAQRGEIIEAIKTVNVNQPYYCRTTSLKLARQIAKSNFNPFKTEGSPSFNDTEKEIIRLICQENTSEEISKHIHMAKRTVQGNRANLRKSRC
ncbi:MAG: response regulator transcription factor [Parafilimonas sp.]|nr:response regulator transcription factor [Parafilimonas sp.]